MHGKNGKKQIASKDPVLFPARMAEKELKQMCPVVLITCEHDFYRREVYEFAKRLMKCGKLSEFCDMAGYKHGTLFTSCLPDSERFWTGFRQSFLAHTK